MRSWGHGYDIGSIFEVTPEVLGRIGSYSESEKKRITNATHLLAYNPGGDCFTYCIKIKKTKDGFKGLDVDKYTFGFYVSEVKTVKQCSKKEMYKLLAGLEIKGE
jgi:hypothetical protein